MPIEDDLVQRTLAELAVALERLNRFGDARAGEPGAGAAGAGAAGTSAAARALLDRAYRRHLGTASEVVRRLPSEELLAIISNTGRLDAERAFLTAALLEVDAALGEADLDPDRDAALRLRALDLYAEAGAARVGVDDLGERVRRVRADLLDHVLPEASYARLLRWYLHAGRFAVAEDLLFEWLEEHGPSATLRAAGERLYDDLEATSDERLEAGELPRDEVHEGRTLFRRSCGA